MELQKRENYFSLEDGLFRKYGVEIKKILVSKSTKEKISIEDDLKTSTTTDCTLFWN